MISTWSAGEGHKGHRPARSGRALGRLGGRPGRRRLTFDGMYRDCRAAARRHTGQVVRRGHGVARARKAEDAKALGNVQQRLDGAARELREKEFRGASILVVVFLFRGGSPARDAPFRCRQ